MAHYENGINGSFHGKVGPTVGCTWKGVDYIRAVPKRSKKTPTAKQAATRLTFKYLQEWLAPLKEVITIGFKEYNPRMTALMASHSYTYNHVLRGEYPNLYMDYASVMISYGDLPGVEDAAVRLPGSNRMEITWNPENELCDAYWGDVLFYLVYNRVTNDTLQGIGMGTRMEGMLKIDIPDTFNNQELEVYIAFKSLKNNRVSMSQYLGTHKLNF
ncbi:hypothetical protein ADIARSV_2175 [Arcticibacter svalbardensis MN12-7]|uniref:Uncharacterized protein n=1 Tax=Arcticibacter svalbardensis MN12-7 TaxID=1150600 RepID=R9GRV3_9SPHI|nr:DUF6266 family protein [Arcticibacter svalbardensis]EOR94577.1 hypothetical protein ADIARSV_2175 [Arcticibacter svalbardensis MN12-7]